MVKCFARSAWLWYVFNVQITFYKQILKLDELTKGFAKSICKTSHSEYSKWFPLFTWEGLLKEIVHYNENTFEYLDKKLKIL